MHTMERAVTVQYPFEATSSGVAASHHQLLQDKAFPTICGLEESFQKPVNLLFSST